MPSSLDPAATSWSSRQTRLQFAAIATLRWRIFLNSFRRKGGSNAGELVGRIVVYFVFASFVLGLVLAAGIAAYFLAAKGYIRHISLELWAIFVICQLLNIQLGQPGTTFDPTQLIRFPLNVRTFVVIRLFFGLLTPANIVGTLLSAAVWLGIAIALPGLWLYALVSLGVFAAANILFSRMIFAWVDRWLSTRRAREIFTGLIFAFSLGIQWANFTFNPAYNHNKTHAVSAQRVEFVQHIYHRIHPVLAFLPPELTASSLVAAEQASALTALGYIAGCALFAAFFLLIFALRMRIEYRGENLSDAATPVGAKRSTAPRSSLPRAAAVQVVQPPAGMPAGPSAGLPARTLLPPPVLAMLGKEFLYVRRSTGILYGLIMPTFLVLIIASKFASRGNALWIFPAAVAYTLLAVGPLSYNSFGLEAAGAQFYFLAPVRMQDVLLAKNLLSFGLAAIEIAAVFAIISYVAGIPSLGVALSAMLWAAGTLAVNTVFGNRRSITNPKKINPQRMANRQASPVSGFISMGILMLSSGIAALLFLGSFLLHLTWLLVPVFLLFAAGCILFYRRSLTSMQDFTVAHREQLLQELCKQS